MIKELFGFKKGHCILYYLDFVSIPVWVNLGSFCFLRVFVFRGEREGEGGTLPGQTTKREILLFADALRISKGQVVISSCESWPRIAAACGKGSLDFIYRKILFSTLYTLEVNPFVSANLVSHIF